MSTWRRRVVGEGQDEIGRSWKVFERVWEEVVVVAVDDEGIGVGEVWRGRGILISSRSRCDLEEDEEDRGGGRRKEGRMRNHLGRIHEGEVGFVSILLDGLPDPSPSSPSSKEEVSLSPVLNRIRPSVRAGFCRLVLSILLSLFSLSWEPLSCCLKLVELVKEVKGERDRPQVGAKGGRRRERRRKPWLILRFVVSEDGIRSGRRTRKGTWVESAGGCTGMAREEADTSKTTRSGEGRNHVSLSFILLELI